MTPTAITPNPARLRRQRRQLDALHAAGALDGEAHARAVAALDARLAATPPTPAWGGRPAVELALALGLAAGIVLAGGVWMTRAPRAHPPIASMAAPSTAAGEPARAPHPVERERMGGTVEALQARLNAAPDDAEGWAMLARSHSVMGRADAAVPAFRRAVALRPDDAVLLADFADALAMTQGRQLAGEPIRLVQRALELEPDNLKALSLAGTEAYDRQDWAAALRHWERLARVAPAGDPLAAQVQGGLAEARQRAGAPARATENARAARGSGPGA